MASSAKRISVYLETGKKRTFAGAIDWPGWCRSGRDEQAALQALFDYAARYEGVLRVAGIEFSAPVDATAFDVKERLEGNATTDFGAPGVAPAADARPLDDAALQQQQRILLACWQALDTAAEAATGKELRKGPRGGGRDLTAVVRHVLGSQGGYIAALGGKVAADGDDADLDAAQQRTRQAILETLAASARGEIPRQGPRGGERWTPRYFIRRDAWHVLDHVWEIEDRAAEG